MNWTSFCPIKIQYILFIELFLIALSHIDLKRSNFQLRMNAIQFL
jgi:hypothetical protein